MVRSIISNHKGWKLTGALMSALVLILGFMPLNFASAEASTETMAVEWRFNPYEPLSCFANIAFVKVKMLSGTGTYDLQLKRAGVAEIVDTAKIQQDERRTLVDPEGIDPGQTVDYVVKARKGDNPFANVYEFSTTVPPCN